MNEEILCFKHCGLVIFCFNLPEVCPVCKISMSIISLDGIPIRLPYPFAKARQHPCSIVIKTTKGSFLEHYSYSKNLHIGVTDSCGTVFEYDSNGLENHNTEDWTQSIIVYKSSEAWSSHWDNTLALLTSDTKWSSPNYDESNFNCYTFVIEFMKQLNSRELNEFIDKEKFCKKFICSKIDSTNEYITVYRNVKENGFSFQHSDSIRSDNG